MNELPWASPEVLGGLMISQILSIGHAEPPGSPKPKALESAAEFEEEVARIDAAEASEASA
jgi:hypothetical protein